MTPYLDFKRDNIWRCMQNTLAHPFLPARSALGLAGGLLPIVDGVNRVLTLPASFRTPLFSFFFFKGQEIKYMHRSLTLLPTPWVMRIQITRRQQPYLPTSHSNLPQQQQHHRRFIIKQSEMSTSSSSHQRTVGKKNVKPANSYASTDDARSRFIYTSCIFYRRARTVNPVTSRIAHP